MLENRLIWFLLIVSQIAFAQIQGKVIDVSGNPVPYVNIWVENANIGTTSEADGTFKINVTSDQILVFSAVGFETLKTTADHNKTFVLAEARYELEEVLVSRRSKPLGKNQIYIGKNSKFPNSYYGCSSQPSIVVNYFPSTKKVQDHPFLKEVTFSTMSEVKSKFNLRLFDVNSDGSPGLPIVDENILVTVDKGRVNSVFNLEKYKITIPDNGIFIGVEWLIVDENKFSKSFTESEVLAIKMQYKELDETQKNQILEMLKTLYEPLFATTISKKGINAWRYHSGKWHNSFQERIALKLTLTN